MRFIEELEKNSLVAAPMAAVTTPPFRKLLRRLFDGIIYTEMASVEGLLRSNAATLEYLDMIDESRPCVLQLFGGDPKSYTEALRIAEGYAEPDAYDVNMGCPVKKVLKTGGGAALLDNLNNLKEIVRTVRRATEKEFSIKVRLGSDEKSMVYRELLSIAEGEGVNALVVHARTKRQMFGGAVNYDALTELAAIAKIPIIGNGNVDSLDTLELMRRTGVSGVMIGRAAMRAPWIFSALKEGKPVDECLTPKEKLSLLYELYGYMLIHAGSNERKKNHYLNLLKKFSVYFSRGVARAAEFRVKLYQAALGEDELFNVLDDFFV
jgi:nifR3 family TIM-barrel protein